MLLSEISKAIGLPEGLDPSHSYVFKSGEYGTFYQYWYVDRAGNYWRYSNAPEDHEDYDPYAGEPLLSSDQPLPHTDPQFFTDEGYKRHIGVPPEVENIEKNEKYSSSSLKNIWFEKYIAPNEEVRFVYLDKDVKENLDLYLQQQLRVVDAGLNKYRKFSANLFQSAHPRDKVFACILMLIDQAYYSLDELVNATVADVEFVDRTIILLGRKLVCDDLLFDFLTSITAGRASSDFLFVIDGLIGKEPIGLTLMSATFYYLKVSPKFLMYWHSTHAFSRIVSHLAFQKVPRSEVEDRAFYELAKVLNTSEDVEFLVDYKVREALLDSYEDSVTKSFSREFSDGFGVSQVFSDLVEKRGDELEFSKWLHSHPLHDVAPDDLEMEEQEEEENTPTEDETPDGAQE